MIICILRPQKIISVMHIKAMQYMFVCAVKLSVMLTQITSTIILSPGKKIVPIFFPKKIRKREKDNSSVKQQQLFSFVLRPDRMVTLLTQLVIRCDFRNLAMVASFVSGLPICVYSVVMTGS